MSYETDDQWSCPSCSYYNSIWIYPLCEVCQRLADQKPDNLRTDNQTWQCSSCTLKNEPNQQHCRACHRQRSTPPSAPVLVNNATTDPSSRSISLTVRERQHKAESNAEHMFQQIIAKCQKARIHFVDDQFPPSRRSIGPHSFVNVAQWLRISEIRPLSDEDRQLPWSVVSSASPSDIQQGALGNCWLVAALALITERPRMLQHILLTQTVNKEGIYLIRICLNGLWQTVIVDDCFPCTQHRHLIFTQARRRQLYVPLIEKACAKVFGCYANLKSGHTSEGLQLLTGAPCHCIDLNPSNRPFESDIVWVKLISACESKLLIGASSGRSDVSDAEYHQVHIHKNHAFSILSAHALSGCSSRFVLVRDPHGRSSYTDDQVTPKVLQELLSVHNARRSTGAFWIAWPKFVRYFVSLTVSTYNEDHFDVRQQTKFTQSATEHVPTFRFHVTQTSFVNISLVYHRRDRTAHSDHTQSFVLCDIDGQVVGRRENILRSRRGGFLYWSGSLQTGFYVLIPFSISFWQQHTPNRDFTLVIHSNIQLDVAVDKAPAVLLADCLISAVIRHCRKPTKNKYSTFYVTSKEVQSKIFIAENLSKTHHLSLDIDMQQARNIHQSRQSYTTHDCIPPGHRQVIFITEWANRSGQSASLHYGMSYIHERQVTNSRPMIDTSRDDIHTPRLYQ